MVRFHMTVEMRRSKVKLSLSLCWHMSCIVTLHCTVVAHSPKSVPLT
jgi:hypothetical protein